MGGPYGSRVSQEERKNPYSKPHLQGSSGNSLPQKVQQSSVQCFNCGRTHIRSVCPRLRGIKKCFNCGKKGHTVKDCPLVRKASTQSPHAVQSQYRRSDKPRASGRKI